MAIENPITQAKIDRINDLIERLDVHDEACANHFRNELEIAIRHDGSLLRNRWVTLSIFLGYLNGDIIEMLAPYEDVKRWEE